MPSIYCPGCTQEFHNERYIIRHFQSHPTCQQHQEQENRVVRSGAVAAPRALAAPTEGDPHPEETGSLSDSSISVQASYDDSCMLPESTDEDLCPPEDLSSSEEESNLSSFPGDEVDNSITSLHERHLKFLNEGNLQVPFNKELRAQTKLAALIQDNKLPFKMYNEIMKWHKSIQELGTLNFHGTKDGNSRETVIKNLKTRYGLEDEPTTTTHTLPHSGQVVEITTHDFTDQLYSLLSDPDLMKDENLLFCDDDVFGTPTESKSGEYVMKDVIDGSVFCKAHKHHVKVEGAFDLPELRLGEYILDFPSAEV